MRLECADRVNVCPGRVTGVMILHKKSRAVGKPSRRQRAAHVEQYRPPMSMAIFDPKLGSLIVTRPVGHPIQRVQAIGRGKPIQWPEW